MVNCKNKTPPSPKIGRGRNEKSCETERNEVVGIQPIARVQIPAVQITAVALVVSDVPDIGVPVERNCMKRRL